MTIPKTDEDAITKEIKALWEFYQDRVDWAEARRCARYVVDTYDGINERLDGMGYEEKLMIHALISLGAALGQTLATPCIVVVRGEDDPVMEGELN